MSEITVNLETYTYIEHLRTEYSKRTHKEITQEVALGVLASKLNPVTFHSDSKFASTNETKTIKINDSLKDIIDKYKRVFSITSDEEFFNKIINGIKHE